MKRLLLDEHIPQLFRVQLSRQDPEAEQLPAINNTVSASIVAEQVMPLLPRLKEQYQSFRQRSQPDLSCLTAYLAWPGWPFSSLRRIWHRIHYRRVAHR